MEFLFFIFEPKKKKIAYWNRKIFYFFIFETKVRNKNSYYSFSLLVNSPFVVARH